MKSQILIKRYTQGLVNAIKDEAEFSELNRQLSDFLILLSSHKDLRDLLASPLLRKNKKSQIIKDILARESSNPKTSRFILLLLEHNRLELLGDILDFLPVCWNEKKGAFTFEVASVVPLTEVQKKRLKKRLELLEKKPVVLSYEIDPELLGGLSVRRGNMVYDISLKGNLMKLKEKICERY